MLSSSQALLRHGLRLICIKSYNGHNFVKIDQNHPKFGNLGKIGNLKVARYSFSGPIPLKFEHKLRRHKQSSGKIATTVVLDKDENLL